MSRPNPKKPEKPRKERTAHKTPKLSTPSSRSYKAKEGKGLPSPSSPAEERLEQGRGGAIGARISRRAADRLRQGHLWVYASDVEAIEPGEGDVPHLLPVADN